MISVIVPTYNERANVARFVPEIGRRLEEAGFSDYEVLVMDDDSPDGTCDAAAALGGRVRAVNRRGLPRGLSKAVVDGFGRARGDILCVMDADGSHPPSVLPALVRAVEGGARVAVGSRYVRGGGVKDWPLRRRAVSRFACWIARPLTAVRDSTSGFFAVRREAIEGVRLDPDGFKIGLEVFVRAAHGGRIVEVPYVFTDRTLGSSKFGTGVVLDYLRQVGRLSKR